jgi:MFS family permease
MPRLQLLRRPDAAGQVPQDAWPGHPKGSTAYRKILAGLAFAGVATFAQLYSTQAVLPMMAADLQVTAAEAALTISLATVGLAATVLPWSFLADRIGRVRAMMWGISAATVLGLLVPLASSFPMLLGLRMLEGAALGGIPAIAIAYLNEEVNKAHAAMAAGTYVAGTTLADSPAACSRALSANSGAGGPRPWPSRSWPPRQRPCS